MTYQNGLGISLHFDYNQFGFEMRRKFGCILPSSPTDTGFDASAGESELMGNNIRRSDHLIPLNKWDQIYKYPTSREMLEYIRQAESNGLKHALGRSPLNQEIVIHEGKFICWWERRRRNAR